MKLDRAIGITFCFAIWALPTALFASLAAWGAYAFDKQRLHRWKQTVDVHTSHIDKHVSVMIGFYHHSSWSIVAISLLLGLALFLLSMGCAFMAWAIWDS